MFNDIKVVAIIPARGGSKGVPKKNILPIDGIPLISHTIKHALCANCIDGVWVSTDDSEIENISKLAGAQIIKRPNSLSTDIVTSEDVLVHALTTLNNKNIFPELIIFLQCTSPFRKETDIDEAFKEYKRGAYDSLLSVSPSHKFLWKKGDDFAVAINYDYEKRPRRQDMDKQYQENGSIYIFKSYDLLRYKNRLSNKIGLYIMDDISSIEIDSLIDLKIADIIMTSLKK